MIALQIFTVGILPNYDLMTVIWFELPPLIVHCHWSYCKNEITTTLRPIDCKKLIYRHYTLSWMADTYLVMVWDQNLDVGMDFYMIINYHCVFWYKKIIWGHSDLKVIIIQNHLCISKKRKTFCFATYFHWFLWLYSLCVVLSDIYIPPSHKGLIALSGLLV